MSDDTGDKRKIEITMTIEDLLRDGITIKTGEDVTVTVVDDSGSVSE